MDHVGSTVPRCGTPSVDLNFPSSALRDLKRHGLPAAPGSGLQGRLKAQLATDLQRGPAEGQLEVGRAGRS